VSLEWSLSKVSGSTDKFYYFDIGRAMMDCRQ
jgi:hypothetical protein